MCDTHIEHTLLANISLLTNNPNLDYNQKYIEIQNCKTLLIDNPKRIHNPTADNDC